MTPESLNMLNQFREKARERDIPPDAVEWWIRTARPCGSLGTRGSGPVVGRLGGPMMIPAQAPDPWCKLAATIDLAALPRDLTDLPLPSDGHLLLFADPDPDSIGYRTLGSALHVSAGTPVEERQVDLDPDPDDDEPYGAVFGEGLLHVDTDLSLPHHTEVRGPESPPTGSISSHPYAYELLDAWDDVPHDGVHPGLQLGGYSVDEYGEEDPAVSAGLEAARAQARGELPPSEAGVSPADWVCLAQWWHGIEGLEMAFFSWSIARQDLAAGHFDRVYATMTWNP
ncbi:DUF1963 domain-containing protein [Streptomyces sp. AC512_CC834]|uniref:DUF1963 domain-containing protein n=1 Tax=Streptomyces sp. AC512_CC834 TaxID=2823691 RepID=UPI001C259031|nr:DUF1963 domain-containing protein [Streptomyces sp. AC512_CC834]